jgi:peroxiredoxin-like protein
MSVTYHFTSAATWIDERRGMVEGDSGAPALDFSSPPEFQGQHGMWTPEHLFVAAVATCFVTTFRAIADFSHFEAAGLEVTAEGTVEKAEGGFRFTRVVVRPMLTISQESDRDRALRLIEKAARSSLVSRSLESEITLEPAVLVALPVPAV